MNLIDTHCHLDAAEFCGEQAVLMQAAQLAGVCRLIVPSVSLANFERVRLLCAAFPVCAPAYGIHPLYTRKAALADLTVLRDYLLLHRPVALGEIGLDFLVANFDRVSQEAFFVAQLKLAREFSLPVLLHVRRAIDPILKHLRQIRVCGGIAHAFNGSLVQAEEFIKLGFKLGFGGAITFTAATRLRRLAALLPLQSMVLETDAPDMPPAFIAKGALNKPEYLPRIAQTLAELRGVSLQEIARVTTENSLPYFNLNHSHANSPAI